MLQWLEFSAIFFNGNLGLCCKSGGQNMTRRSKKEKTAGLEQHRQLKRTKKMKRKQKKKIGLPKRRNKGKK